MTEPKTPGLYVVAKRGASATVRVGPAVAWDDRDGELLWSVEPQGPALTDAEHALRDAPVRGSLALPAGWNWRARVRA